MIIWAWALHFYTTYICSDKADEKFWKRSDDHQSLSSLIISPTAVLMLRCTRPVKRLNSRLQLSSRQICNCNLTSGTYNPTNAQALSHLTYSQLTVPTQCTTWGNTFFKIPSLSLLNRHLQPTSRKSNLGEYLHRLCWKLGRHLCTAPRRPPWNCDILPIKSEMRWAPREEISKLTRAV